MNWIESFNLLNQPINPSDYSGSVHSNSVEKFKKELIIKFPGSFSEYLGRCTKEATISKRTGMLSKMDYSE